jgi:hypothetical protein
LNSLTRHLRSGFDRFQVEFRPVMWPVSVSIYVGSISLFLTASRVVYLEYTKRSIRLAVHNKSPLPFLMS